MVDQRWPIRSRTLSLAVNQTNPKVPVSHAAPCESLQWAIWVNCCSADQSRDPDAAMPIGICESWLLAIAWECCLVYLEFRMEYFCLSLYTTHCLSVPVRFMEPPTMLLVPKCRDMQLWWDNPQYRAPEIGFRSRFSQCVDYMRFNEKSFCFRWQESTKLMLFGNTKTTSLVTLCDLRYLTGNIGTTNNVVGSYM